MSLNICKSTVKWITDRDNKRIVKREIFPVKDNLIFKI